MRGEEVREMSRRGREMSCGGRGEERKMRSRGRRRSEEDQERIEGRR
jgi:hypothetical protein